MSVVLSFAQRRLKTLLVVVCLSLAAGTVNATLVRLNGANFDVEYDDATLGVFGAPTIGGNVVFFTPTTFKAESLNGSGWVSTAATAALRIIAQNGFLIGSANLTARGDYRMLGASSQVQVGGTIMATPGSGGVPLVAAISTSAPLTVRSGALTNWNASALLDFGGVPSGGFTEIQFDMQSVLSAYTHAADTGPKLAFIEEKFAGSAFVLKLTPTGQVPEPSSLALVTIAALAWSAVRRKPRRGSAKH